MMESDERIACCGDGIGHEKMKKSSLSIFFAELPQVLWSES